MTRLSTTPVKGLALHHPQSIELGAQGAAGDRRLYLVDDSGTLQSCTRNPDLYGLIATWDEESRRLEVTRDGEVVASGPAEATAPVTTDMFGLRDLEADVVGGPLWAPFFSDVLGRSVRLLRARGSAYNVRPATLLGTASVTELARQAGLPSVDARRFRMLIEFDGGPPHAEDAWHGRLLRIGGAVLRAEGPVKRCAATTRHPETGASDLQTLRMITAYRGRQESVLGMGATFGIYGEVVEPGRVAVGDALLVDA